MRILVRALWALVLALSACGRGTDDPVGKVIDEYLSARAQMGQWSGAVLVASGDRVLLRKGYGFADVYERVPYEPSTRHEVASISKMFTALAALKLRDQGMLSLDDSVCEHLDECPDAWQGVTLRHLVYHQSGIPDYEEQLELGSDRYFEQMTRPHAAAEILAAARTQPLEFEPGQKFRYSNTGYIVLGYALEEASGMPFARLLTESVLKQADMTESGVLGDVAKPKKLAVGYTWDDLGWEAMLRGVRLTEGHLRPVPQLTLTPPQGDGWMYSTVDDLLRFSRHLEGGGFLAPSLVEEITTPSKGGYAAGWFVDRAFERRRMRHNGIFPGYVSEFIRFPDDRVTIVLFSNLDRARLNRIARDVSAITLGQPFDMPVRGDMVELTASQVSRLIGDYVTEDGRNLNVRKEPDYLTAELKGQYIAGLIPLSPTEMYFPLADGKAVFTLGDDGRAARVNMRFGGEDHVATRVPEPSAPF